MKLKIFGIEIRLSFIPAALLSVLIVLDQSGNLCCCLLSAILHELGHIIAMCRRNCKPEKIVIKLFDIQIIDGKRSFCSQKDSLVIVLSGALTNFALSLISAILYYFFEIEILYLFTIVNFLTGAFNLLPVSNLDGGQALYLLLSRKFSEKSTERIIDALTVILILPTAILGFVVLFQSKYNFSLLLISIYLVLSLILKRSRFF